MTDLALTDSTNSTSTDLATTDLLSTSNSVSADLTLHEVGQQFLQYLKTQGKKDNTVATYSKDLEVIEKFFGSDRQIRKIIIPHVAQFLKSDIFLKLPNGKDKAKPTIDKITRFFRMMLIFAQENRMIDVLPLTKDVSLGRNAKKAKVKVVEAIPKEEEKVDEKAEIQQEEILSPMEINEEAEVAA
ncbi:MAG: hypothetical protein HQK78_03215 [Desulfobacterales bacterium]|nr:hypothetical protein [Desulfobacterales bacterium]